MSARHAGKSARLKGRRRRHAFSILRTAQSVLIGGCCADLPG